MAQRLQGYAYSGESVAHGDVEPVFGLNPHRDGYGAAADRSKRVWTNHRAGWLPSKVEDQ
jgi:hypothetical protein